MDPYKQLMLALLESFKNDVINAFTERYIEELNLYSDFSDAERNEAIKVLKGTAETFKREYKIEGNNKDG